VLCQLFGELTGAEQVGLDDGFFELGGHSLLAMRLVAKVREQTGRELTVRAIFEHPTVGALADVLLNRNHLLAYQPILPLRLGGELPPLFCLHPGGGSSTVFTHFVSALQNNRPVYGLQARGLEGSEKPFESFEEMIKTYVSAISEIYPTGDLNFIGYSVGGVIAQHLSCVFSEMGRKIGAVVLMDSAPPTAGPVEEAPSKAQLLQSMAKAYGWEPEENASANELLEMILVSFVKESLVPTGTPIQWVDRMLTELILSGQRLSTHRVRQGDFDLIYLLAAAINPDPEVDDKRLTWDSYCRSVRYVPVQTFHNGMLDPEPAKTIANVVDGLLSQ
jgi:thioesterase domain-containing protein/aryl carrier-like protein